MKKLNGKEKATVEMALMGCVVPCVADEKIEGLIEYVYNASVFDDESLASLVLPKLLEKVLGVKERCNLKFSHITTQRVCREPVLYFLVDEKPDVIGKDIYGNFCYALNLSTPDFSELGYVATKKVADNMYRVIH